MDRSRLAAAGMCMALALSACASIPLSTLWALREFGPEDLAAVEPADVRVATLVEPAVGDIDPAKSHLKLTLTPREGPPEVHLFGLRLSRVQGGPVVPAGDPRWQVFELDDAGLVAMRKVKPRLADLESDYRAWALNVSMQGFDEVPAQVEALHLSVRVQLADDQAPLTLFDRAEIPMERGG